MGGCKLAKEHNQLLSTPWISRVSLSGDNAMADTQANLGKALIWGGLTAFLYWGLFHFADRFQQLAHTTLDACVVQEAGQTSYYNEATAELCTAKGGEFIKGSWWYVFAPIALAFALSYTHGLFTGLFWEVVGLRAKK